MLVADWVINTITPMRNHYHFFLIPLVISLGNGCGLVATPEQESGALSTDNSSTDQFQAQQQKSPASVLDAKGDTLFFAGDYDNALLALPITHNNLLDNSSQMSHASQHETTKPNQTHTVPINQHRVHQAIA